MLPLAKSIKLAELIIFSAIGVVLIRLSVSDIRTRKIPVSGICAAGFLSGLGAVSGMISEVISEMAVSAGAAVAVHLAGAAIGGSFLLLSMVTRESLGYGDSILILFLGICLGRDDILRMLVISWALAALWAGLLLIRNRFRRHMTMPMVPFLATGFWLWFLFYFLF